MVVDQLHSAAKLVTIPNRPDPRDLAPTRPRDAVRAQLHAAPGDALIGVVARLTPQKGVADFLDAAARLTRPHAWRAAIVGDGPERGDLEQRALSLGIADRCVFTGTRTDLGDLLAAFDLLVVPSWSEGLPYLVLEAMLAGTPLVATAVGGIPRVVGDGATDVAMRREADWFAAFTGVVRREAVVAAADSVLASFDELLALSY